MPPLQETSLDISTMQESSSKLLATLFAENKLFSVSELNERIKEVLEIEFFALNVQGEVSNYKRHTSGHWYFTLKDSNSQLRAVFFRQWNRLMRFEPENGLEVRIRGRLSVYEPRGEYQVIVETLEPVGIGTLQLAFEQQIKRFSAEGLFDVTRKRSLPAFPRRIGIITSPVGAVLRDILQVLKRRNPAINIVIAPVRVQGNGAAGEIADAIRLLNKHAKQKSYEIDVIIVGRGGGSIEDLWVFNEEQVARAIYSSEIPIVSAVGHETDFTVADFVADLRAPTPSVAAELVAADAGILSSRIADLQQHLHRAAFYYLFRRRTELRNLTESRGFVETGQAVIHLSTKCRELESRTAAGLQNCLRLASWRLQELQRRLITTDFRAAGFVNQARLITLSNALKQALQKRLEWESRRLAVESGKLNMLSPLAVLGRGYALVKDETGRLVTQAASLTERQNLKLRFADGEADCRVI
jgi:exodeoxyribonuclease VII large subunit